MPSSYFFPSSNTKYLTKGFEPVALSVQCSYSSSSLAMDAANGYQILSKPLPGRLSQINVVSIFMTRRKKLRRKKVLEGAATFFVQAKKPNTFSQWTEPSIRKQLELSSGCVSLSFLSLGLMETSPGVVNTTTHGCLSNKNKILNFSLT